MPQAFEVTAQLLSAVKEERRVVYYPKRSYTATEEMRPKSSPEPLQMNNCLVVLKQDHSLNKPVAAFHSKPIQQDLSGFTLIKHFPAVAALDLQLDILFC